MERAYQIVEFLREIGLAVVVESFDRDTFLPGIDVRQGGLVVDLSKLNHPCDLLHEAGHLAVVTSEVRATLNGEVAVANADVVEVAAIAWSYAAAIHLDIEPAELFHEGGYGGQAPALAHTYSLGVYPGASHLADLGLTGTLASDGALIRYPGMALWLVP